MTDKPPRQYLPYFRAFSDAWEYYAREQGVDAESDTIRQYVREKIDAGQVFIGRPPSAEEGGPSLVGQTLGLDLDGRYYLTPTPKR